MHFQALQKRAKETKRQEKKTEVKQKDGTVKVIQKYVNEKNVLEDPSTAVHLQDFCWN